MKKDTKKTVSIVINLIIFVWTVISIGQCLFWNTDPEVAGTICFRYFTIDSNILCGISALVLAIAELSGKVTKGHTLFKYSGTCAVALTFLTVVFFLGPTMGYEKMVKGENFYMHLMGPILAIVSFCFLEKNQKLQKQNIIFGILPTVIYAAVYLSLVLVIGETNGGWKDFYGFNAGGRWYISLPAMLTASYFISLVIYKIHNKGIRS